MGEEIDRTAFSAEDFARFAARLRDETALLERNMRAGEFQDGSFTLGCELEAWLLDHNHVPLPANAAFLERLGDPLVVPELSAFNVELNSTPVRLDGSALARMEQELTARWHRCVDVAHEMGAQLLLIGTLPTIREQDLTLAHISPLNRYHALNAQVLRARGGAPITIDIEGREHLHLQHDDVMLEAGTTSFQVHLQCPAADTVRYYNASLILSAPLVAIAANAPFLFGHDLWAETRVPLFEQAVDLGERQATARDDGAQQGGERQRVTFGSDYLHASPIEAFLDNLARFPVLLPMQSDDKPEKYRHLRLHNGTIWRWNRLLLGVPDGGIPHVRIEQRVMPAGPTIIDMMANTALYVGAARVLATLDAAPEHDLSFDEARDNFQRAARDGLDARLTWLDGHVHTVRELLLEELIPMAHAGLALLGIDEADRERYLDIAAARVRSGQNGASWQRAWCARHGRDPLRLSVAYLERQRNGAPVHEWTLS